METNPKEIKAVTMPMLLNGRETAERLGMSYDTLMYLRRTGTVEAIRLTNGRYVFNLDRVVEAIRAHYEQPAEIAHAC